MRSLNSAEVIQYTHTTLTHSCIQSLEAILAFDIVDLLSQDPYMLPTVSPTLAGRLVEDALAHHLRKVEAGFVDALLCDLAGFVVRRRYDGCRSNLPGVDLEFKADGMHYLLAVSPSANGQDNTVQKHRAKALRRAMAECDHATQPVLGYCYGRAKTGYVGGCLRVAGRNFWSFISGDQLLYLEVAEIVNRSVKTCRDAVVDQEARAINRLTKQFIDQFCAPDGAIDWVKLVEFNSGNYDLDKFLPSGASPI